MSNEYKYINDFIIYGPENRQICNIDVDRFHIGFKGRSDGLFVLRFATKEDLHLYMLCEPEDAELWDYIIVSALGTELTLEDIKDLGI